MAMALIGIFDPKQLAHSPLTRIACGSVAANPETPQRASILLEGVRPKHSRHSSDIASAISGMSASA